MPISTEVLGDADLSDRNPNGCDIQYYRS